MIHEWSDGVLSACDKEDDKLFGYFLSVLWTVIKGLK